MTVQLSQTERGFSLGTFKDAVGVECSIQTSSLATEAAIWFGVRDANPQKVENGVLIPVEPPVKPIPIFGFPGHNHKILYNTRMHLTVHHVKTLIRNFEKFLETKKVRSRKFTDRYGSECSIRLNNGLIELGCDDAKPQICDRGWRPVEFPKGTIFTTHMFLRETEIKKLLVLMKGFIKHGYVRDNSDE